MDKNKLRAIRADLEAALAAVGTKHGVAFSIGTMRFSPTTFKCELAAATVSAAGDDTPCGVAHKWTIDWNRSAVMFGLPRDALGKTIDYFGRKLVIAGLAPRKSKPVVLKDGGRFLVVNADFVKRQLEAV